MKSGLILCCALCALALPASQSARAADPGDRLARVNGAARETNNLLGMFRGMLSMVNADIAAMTAKNKGTPPDEDGLFLKLQADKTLAEDAIKNMTATLEGLMKIQEAARGIGRAYTDLIMTKAVITTNTDLIARWKPGPFSTPYDIRRMRREITAAQKKIPDLEKKIGALEGELQTMLDAQAKKDADAATLRTGAEKTRKDLNQFTDQEFFFGEPAANARRLGSRFYLQAPVAPKAISPELAPRIADYSWWPVPAMPSISAAPAPAIIPFPTILPFPGINPVTPAYPPTLPFIAPGTTPPYTPPATLPFKPR